MSDPRSKGRHWHPVVAWERTAEGTTDKGLAVSMDVSTNRAEALLEIEAIKQLKARYCRHLDTKDWTAWRQLFTDDFVSDTSESGGKAIEGADDFVAFTRKSLRSQATVHQVHAPEIELTSSTTARGVWALEDVVRFGPGVNLRGYGHYTETYQRVGTDWLIATSKLTRLREDVFNGLVAVYISPRIRRLLMGAARRFIK